ncbi:hypothetical protein [Listeria fleischmannii]|uniref:Uncharacterized protein n=1 Tax=Listeria fleischmannii FSL S10-1203 TaxID=1265822 RepID=W7E2S8_9LIST|nr:hypothetical protein [Listeria fleischmannii]EUJ65517.1 hypothetical protein MCOL2_00615 [Listeria fleischmannii FSL S10-1203]
MTALFLVAEYELMFYNGMRKENEMRKTTLLISVIMISSLLSLVTIISGYKLSMPPIVLVVFTAVCLAFGLFEWRAKHFNFAYIAFFLWDVFMCAIYFGIGRGCLWYGRSDALQLGEW